MADYEEVWKPSAGDATHLGDVRAWREGEHEYTYVSGNHPLAIAHHTLMMHHADRSKPEMLSQMMMDKTGRVSSIETHPEHLREGHATRLFNFAKKLSAKYEDFPEPQHSSSRTPEGNAWAKSVGAEDLNPNVNQDQFMRRTGWGEDKPDHSHIISSVNTLRQGLLEEGIPSQKAVNRHADATISHLTQAQEHGSGPKYKHHMETAHKHADSLADIAYYDGGSDHRDLGEHIQEQIGKAY